LPRAFFVITVMMIGDQNKFAKGLLEHPGRDAFKAPGLQSCDCNRPGIIEALQLVCSHDLVALSSMLSLWAWLRRFSAKRGNQY
jgi:hypothetical protein